MAYRDEHDLRIGQLQQLVATEPQLVRERMRVRHEHDRLLEQSDAVGIELATAERSWLADDEDRRALATRHERLASELAQLAARERDLDARLAEIASGRTELARLEAAAVRAMGGPPGQRLRELERELARIDEVIGLLDPVVTLAERADALATALRDQQATARTNELPLVERGVVSEYAMDLGEDVDTTVAVVRSLVAALDRLRAHEHWRDDAPLERATRPLADEHRGSLENSARRACKTIGGVLSLLGAQLLALRRERDRLDRERVAVIATSI